MKILKENSVIWLDHNKRLFILLKNGGREPLPEIVQSSFLLKVLCNGGMATELSLLYLLDVGSADLPVDFRHHYRASWLGKLVRCFSKNTLWKNTLKRQHNNL